jgi:hypothetical protein
MKDFVLVKIVVNNTISVTVERAAAFKWRGVRTWRRALFGFDIVGTTLQAALGLIKT